LESGLSVTVQTLGGEMKLVVLMGLVIGSLSAGAATYDVCKRSYAVIDTLEKAVGTTCDKITDQDLAGIDSYLAYVGANTYVARDFEGMTSLRYVDIGDEGTIEADALNGLNLETLVVNFYLYSGIVRKDAFNGLTAKTFYFEGNPDIEGFVVEPGAFNGINVPEISVHFYHDPYHDNNGAGDRLFESLVNEYPNLKFSRL
jgi:hypothetical protein